MGTHETLRHTPKGHRRVHFDPVGPPGVKITQGGCQSTRVKSALAGRARRRGHALDTRAPPHDDRAVLGECAPGRERRRLFDENGHEGRRIPEPHQPDSRSSRIKSEIGRPSVVGVGGRSRIQRGSPRPRLMMPARSRRARRPPSSSAVELAGSSRATGTPRSVIRIVSPALTRSRRAESPFFASVTVARFTWLI